MFPPLPAGAFPFGRPESSQPRARPRPSVALPLAISLASLLCSRCGGSVGTLRTTCKRESYLFGRALPGLNGSGRPCTTALHGGGGGSGGSGGVGTALPPSCRPLHDKHCPRLCKYIVEQKTGDNRSPVPILNLGGLTYEFCHTPGH
jgi:hypothetical protein